MGSLLNFPKSCYAVFLKCARLGCEKDLHKVRSFLWEAVGWMEGVRGKRQNLYSGFDPVAYLPWDFPFSEPWVLHP